MVTEGDCQSPLGCPWTDSEVLVVDGTDVRTHHAPTVKPRITNAKIARTMNRDAAFIGVKRRRRMAQLEVGAKSLRIQDTNITIEGVCQNTWKEHQSPE